MEKAGRGQKRTFANVATRVILWSPCSMPKLMPMDPIDARVSAIKSLDSPQSDVLLFKYRDIDSILDQVLLEQLIYFSPPSKLNDPFDCQHNLLNSFRHAIGRKDAQRPDLLEALLVNKEELLEIERAVAGSGVCAFSTSLTNPLLWSHYAAGGQGCCVIFRFPQKFFSEIPDVLGLEDVAYDNSGLSRWLWMDAHRYMTDEATNPHNLKHFFTKLNTRMLATKGKSWGYEEETRIVRSTSGPLTVDPKFVAGLCFGMRTSEEKIQYVIRRAHQGGLNCSYFQIVKDETDFGLTVRKLDGPEHQDSDLAQRIPLAAISPVRFAFDELIKRDMARQYLSQKY